ncbi:MAG: hypothetical protein WAN66_22025 [Limnoraphis robusta]|nr:hypothetical protein [Limnoraphis robusta]MEA5497030.1 hypothetical protein [Limnoraphis robusta BA-68 BA1]MEA5539568.1 hypothetical protein [Limnoraphis robusta Tam1]
MMDKTTPRKSRKTAVITLVLIASVGLKACESSNKRREVYRNLPDCQQEWGKPELCEPITDNSYPVGYYYGPYYRYRNGNYYYYRTYNSPPRVIPVNAGVRTSPPPRSGLFGRSSSPNRSRSSVGNTRRGGFGSGGRVGTGSRGG